jgi:hypothetical protein
MDTIVLDTNYLADFNRLVRARDPAQLHERSCISLVGVADLDTRYAIALADQSVPCIRTIRLSPSSGTRIRRPTTGGG